MSPAEICARAKRYGYKSVALTDRDNLYGTWAFLAACRREGIRPIIGSEISEPGTDRIVTCLVRNRTGYSHLCNLLTRRHTEKNFSLEKALAQF